MFRTNNFDKLLDKATSHLLMEPDWSSTMALCDLIRQNDVQPKVALNTLKKKLGAQNPHSALFSLLVLESMVKNCGTAFQEELASKGFCDFLHELMKTTTYDNVKQKTLELIQTWSFAFRKNSKQSMALKDLVSLLKAEGYKFPAHRESDAMFSADTAPEWADGEVCHRCRVAFSLMQRKHHCRACGQVFCAQCSQKTATLPKFGIEKEVRVCDACFEHTSKPTAGSKAAAEKQETDLPIEYLTSSLAQQNQTPPKKTEEELREEEELQLAIALSQSEAEAKEKFKPKGASSGTSILKVSEPRPADPSPIPAEESLNPELAKYLNRSYWESRTPATTTEPARATSPSAPSVTTIPLQNDDPKSRAKENGITDTNLEEFISTLKAQVEIFINRMKSNSSRGRSIANDSSVQTLFMNITAMHSKLLNYIQEHDDNRLHYERLQDKLTQVKDARAALDALRDEHRDKLRREAEEAERLRQLQMAHKLEIMRKKKQEYLQYQRQIALQRIQEQEREMQMRQEQQKQQYLMGGAQMMNMSYMIHGQAQQPQMGPQGQFPPNSAPPTVGGYHQYGPPQQSQQGMMQPPHSAPHMGHMGAPQGMHHQQQVPMPPPGFQPMPQSSAGLGHSNQGMTPQQMHQSFSQQNVGSPPMNMHNPNVMPNQGMMGGPNPGIPPPQQFQQQQPGAPSASPQVPRSQQNGEAQTAELISFD